MQSRFKHFTILAIVLGMVALALPAAAQQEGFQITPDQLQAPFAEYAAAGFSLNFDVAVESATVSLGDGTVTLDVVMHGMGEVSPQIAQAIVAPVVVDGIVSWRYVDATVSSEFASVELPYVQARSLFQTMQTALSSSFVDSVRTAMGEAGSATGDFSFEDVIITRGELAVTVNDVAPNRSGNLQDVRTITVMQDQMNQSFAAMTQRADGIDYLTVEITGEQLQYKISLRDAAGDWQPVFVNYVYLPEFKQLFGTEGGPTEVVGNNGLFSGDMITMEATGEPAPPDLARRATQVVNQATNRNIAMQIDLSAVTDVTGFPGGLEFIITDGFSANSSRGNNPEQIEVPEARFNRAFAAMVATTDAINSHSLSLGDGSVRFMMTASQVCDNQEILGVVDGFDNTPLFFTSLTCAGMPLELSEVRLGNFEIQDLMSRAFMRVIHTAAGNQPIAGIEVSNGVVIIVIG